MVVTAQNAAQVFNPEVIKRLPIKAQLFAIYIMQNVLLYNTALKHVVKNTGIVNGAIPVLLDDDWGDTPIPMISSACARNTVPSTTKSGGAIKVKPYILEAAYSPCEMLNLLTGNMGSVLVKTDDVRNEAIFTTELNKFSQEVIRAIVSLMWGGDINLNTSAAPDEIKAAYGDQNGFIALAKAKIPSGQQTTGIGGTTVTPGSQQMLQLVQDAWNNNRRIANFDKSQCVIEMSDASYKCLLQDVGQLGVNTALLQTQTIDGLTIQTLGGVELFVNPVIDQVLLQQNPTWDFKDAHVVIIHPKTALHAGLDWTANEGTLLSFLSTYDETYGDPFTRVIQVAGTGLGMELFHQQACSIIY